MKRFHPIGRQAALTLLLATTLVGCKFLIQNIVQRVDRWSDGTVRREGTLEGGVQTGPWVYNYPNGKVRARGEYRDDHQVGPWVFYYEGGQLESRGSYDENGHRTGEWTYNFPNEQVRAVGHYHDDFEVGPWRFFHQQGGVRQEGWFHAGRKSGVWTTFWPDGKQAARGMFHKGQEVGTWRYADEQGRASVKDFGTPAGCQLVLDRWPEEEGGGRRRVGILEGDQLAGTWTCYHPDGSVRISCSFTDGRPDGWFEAGRIGGAPMAQGRVTDEGFEPGCEAFGPGGSPAELLPGPLPSLPPTAGEWSPPGLADQREPALVLATWLAEARMRGAATDEAEPGEEADLPAAPEQLVAQVAEAPSRVPARYQPSWTIRQEEELPQWVDAYRSGMQGTTRGLSSRYGPVRKGSQGPRQRRELQGKPLPVTRFEAVDGTVVDTTDFIGKKRVMVVVLRGFAGEVCVYCVAQTKALALSKERFDRIGLEVLVVYPGSKGDEQAFLQAYRETFDEEEPPYKVFFDPGLDLVTRLGIQGGDLAFPTTIVVGKDGLVELAFVGEHEADRPAAKKLMELIEEMDS